MKSQPKDSGPRSDLLEALKGLSAPDYYDSATGKFLVRNLSERWLPLSESQFKRNLRSRGIKTKAEEGDPLSEADKLILDIQDHRDISYSGRLCGRNSGLYEENGNRFLVTESMSLPNPSPGQWGTLKAVFEGLLKTGETSEIAKAQVHTFYGWLQSSVRALRNGRYQQQQALALCGPAGCGKSLVQHLITELLAGRSAKAARYMLGKTDFNADLFQAEHLILEDEHCSSRISERLKLGAAIKEISVGSNTASLHAKRRDAINIRPWWRLSITLNDDPEAMTILPPLDKHLADKIILLRASPFSFPMPVESGEEQEKFRRQLSDEIPAFLQWLLEQYQIHNSYSDPRRYLIATFHHPELRAALEEMSPEASLLELINRAFADEFSFSGEVTKSAEAIQLAIERLDSRKADKLFHFQNACGTFLGRLASRHPERVEQRRTAEQRLWLIRAPQAQGN